MRYYADCVVQASPQPAAKKARRPPSSRPLRKPAAKSTGGAGEVIAARGQSLRPMCKGLKIRACSAYLAWFSGVKRI